MKNYLRCYEKRNVFNFLKVKSCNNCEYIKEDELFIIGKNIIELIYLDNYCSYLNNDLDIAFMFSKKIMILLKDAYYYNEKIIFAIIDKDELDYCYESTYKYGISYMDVFNAFIDIGLNIEIILI